MKSEPVFIGIEEHNNMQLNESGPVSTKSLSDFEHLRITDLSNIPEPEPIIKISGETFAVADDFFTFSGESKSGKSAITYNFIACSISKDGTIPDGLDGVEVKANTMNQAVIHFDTEQAKHKHFRNVKGIIKRAGHSTCPPFFLSYNIRQLSRQEYQGTTTTICKLAAEAFNGIHSIWIDGGADYVADTNDPGISNEMVKYFMDLAAGYHTAVFIIVHTNPGGDKERGHFGSECQRKSGGIIQVKSSDAYSWIEPKMLRYAGKADIPQLMFEYNKEKGYHVGCGVNSKEEKAAAKKKANTDDLWKLCQSIFSGPVSFGYEEANGKIMIEKACKERTAKDTFKRMNVHGMIIQGNDKNWRLNERYNNELQ